MRTGIVYMVATVLCIFVTSCFTGVESTKKITMPDTGEIAAQSPEDRFIESYFVQQGCDTQHPGRRARRRPHDALAQGRTDDRRHAHGDGRL